MTTLVVTSDKRLAGQICIAKSVANGAEYKSTYDSHGKARFRHLSPGKYDVRQGNATHRVEVNKANLSLGRRSLSPADREYLAWLELSAKQKDEAIRNNDPIAKWAVGVKVQR